LTAQRVERLERPSSSSFDLGNWRLETARLAAACCILAFAAAAWSQQGVWRLAGAVLLFDVAVQALPWRLPRSERSTASIWAEEGLCLVGPTVFFVVVVAQGRAWATAMPEPWWFPVALLVGVGLVWVGGMPIRALLSGALGFLSRPLRRQHKWSRAASIVIAPPGEEALFRGVVLAASSATTVPLGVLGGAAFVAQHHLAPGLSARTPPRAVATQIVAASVLLALTLASGSIYPALLAHYVNNAPSVLLEIQRPTREG
jgi:membrane protease YdiL (CAAX protease family)